jgi:hypothetical protein
MPSVHADLLQRVVALHARNARTLPETGKSTISGKGHAALFFFFLFFVTTVTWGDSGGKVRPQSGVIKTSLGANFMPRR